MGEYGDAVVLFDMDGVLVDSGSSIREGLTAWSRERGLDTATVLEHAHGRTDRDLAGLVAPHLDTAEEAERIQEHEIAHDATVRAMPGAVDLLTEMEARGRTWAVVTSAGRTLALSRLSTLGLPEPRVLVSADDVEAGKPDPGPYLLGAERVGAPPADCVVVEDSPNGAAAGVAAGMAVVAVATMSDPGELEHATTVVADVPAAARLLL
ncbi:HAD-IA family hydrolase [Nocardiopsis sp. HNM0947]|uniref:HAD-IA family hydrolase n=1 Tax=Nocardiopsis coralli TaxID=2772213 RepID=A0ABR9PAL1_9ACTN|nr:HAD-IA family hydrolase [Nocardiopsis coralli]MBE3000869.1 HAD-IA family hydrolase [Nocardiopsis coralli]